MYVDDPLFFPSGNSVSEGNALIYGARALFAVRGGKPSNSKPCATTHTWADATAVCMYEFICMNSYCIDTLSGRRLVPELVPVTFWLKSSVGRSAHFRPTDRPPTDRKANGGGGAGVRVDKLCDLSACLYSSFSS